ncbi:hypothetical protein Anapl_14702 [Anas platyrhynchos]|uniref:Uncharacterized protein n=1 Tax=Anas platyrhynchos TaxID=8839 RepID=R0K3G9_ANAPL|nr:hypothetical protein Anapl_14702 [Anas platyrhynchos]
MSRQLDYRNHEKHAEETAYGDHPQEQSLQGAGESRYGTLFYFIFKRYHEKQDIVQLNAIQMFQGLGHRILDICSCWLGQGKLRGNLVAAYDYLKGTCKGDRVKFSLTMLPRTHTWVYEAPDQGEEKKQALNKEKRARKLLKILGMVYGSIRNRFADNFGEKTYEHVLTSGDTEIRKLLLELSPQLCLFLESAALSGQMMITVVGSWAALCLQHALISGTCPLCIFLRHQDSKMQLQWKMCFWKASLAPSKLGLTPVSHLFWPKDDGTSTLFQVLQTKEALLLLSSSKSTKARPKPDTIDIRHTRFQLDNKEQEEACPTGVDKLDRAFCMQEPFISSCLHPSKYNGDNILEPTSSFAELLKGCFRRQIRRKKPGLKDNNPAREKFTPYRLLETSTPVGNLAESLADIKGLRTQCPLHAAQPLQCAEGSADWQCRLSQCLT